MHLALGTLGMGSGGQVAMGLRLSAPAARAPIPILNGADLFTQDLNLLYDGECTVCQWEKDNLLSLGGKDAIRFTNIEDESDARNGGVSYADGMARITAVTREGEVLTGMRVFEACYQRVGLGWVFAPLSWPVVGKLIEASYEVFATVRTDVTRGKPMRELISARQARISMSADGGGRFDWTGFERSRIEGLARPLVLARGSKGFAACGYIDVATCDKLEEACIIFTGVNSCEDFVESEVIRRSEAAASLGVEAGMRGSDALERIR